MVSPAQVRAWSVFGTIGLEGLTESIRKLEMFTASGRRTQGQLGDLGVALNSTAGRFALGAAAAGAFAVALSTVQFAQFDQAMTRSTAIMGDMSDAMRNEMAEAAKDVARVTTFSADETAEAYFFLASAGLDAKQSIEALPEVAKIAQAGNFSLARSTDLVTDAQSALGLASDNAAENLENMKRVGDAVVAANTLANASTEQFAESLTGKLGAHARRLGKDVEEVTAVLALMADRGVKGTAANERFAIILRDLIPTFVASKDAFENLNIEIVDGQGNMRHMADIVEDFENALGHLSDEEAGTAMAMLGLNQRVADGMQLLMDGSEEIRNFEDSILSLGGIADEVADKQLDNLIDKIKLLMSRIADTALTIGGPFVAAIEALIDVDAKYNEAVTGFWQNLADGKRAVEERRRATQELADIYPQLAHKLSDAKGSAHNFNTVMMQLDDTMGSNHGNLINWLDTLRQTGEISLTQMAQVERSFNNAKQAGIELADETRDRILGRIPEGMAQFANGSDAALIALQRLAGIAPNVVDLFAEVGESGGKGIEEIVKGTLDYQRHLLQIGEITASQLLPQIQARIDRLMEEGGQIEQVMALERERYQLQQQIAREEERRRQEEIRAVEEAEAAFLRSQRAEMRILQQRLEMGEITRDEFINSIRIIADAFDDGTTDKIAAERAIQREQQKTADERQRQMQLELRAGRISLDERLFAIQTELQAERLSTEERLDLQEELLSVRERQVQNHIRTARTLALTSKEAARDFLSAWIEAFEALEEEYPELISKMQDAKDRIVATITEDEDLNNMDQHMERIGKSLIDGLVRGIMDGEMDLKSIVKGFIARGITSLIAKELDIASPSRVTMGFGKQTSLGLALGIEQGAPEVARAWKSTLDMLTAPNVDLPMLSANGIDKSSMPNREMVVELRGAPAPPISPLEAARDNQWQEMMRESVLVAKNDGFRGFN